MNEPRTRAIREAGRNLMVVVGVTLITLLVVVGAIRWLFPGLFERLVATGESIGGDSPSFYSRAIRPADYTGEGQFLVDPVTGVRGRPGVPPHPGYGPHDILGFRNLSIPHAADIVVIGDSMTYGVNVAVEENWVSRMAEDLSDRPSVIYNMSAGGWGPVQYLQMVRHAMVLRPQVIVVAFHTGNDAVDSFAHANSSERWADLRDADPVDPDDRPPYATSYPPPADQSWPVHFPDGVVTVFTPRYRLAANATSFATVASGYRIWRRAAERIADIVRPTGIRLVYTIIPTKELVYAEKVRASGIEPDPYYDDLVRLERENIDNLLESLASIDGVTVADVVGPLTEAALLPVQLYFQDANGHPAWLGYHVIGTAVADVVRSLLPRLPDGAFVVDNGQSRDVYLNSPDGLYRFYSTVVAQDNGWQLSDLPTEKPRSILTTPIQETILRSNPDTYGPGGRLMNAEP